MEQFLEGRKWEGTNVDSEYIELLESFMLLVYYLSGVL